MRLSDAELGELDSLPCAPAARRVMEAALKMAQRRRTSVIQSDIGIITLRDLAIAVMAEMLIDCTGLR